MYSFCRKEISATIFSVFSLFHSLLCVFAINDLSLNRKFRTCVLSRPFQSFNAINFENWISLIKTKYQLICREISWYINCPKSLWRPHLLKCVQLIGVLVKRLATFNNLKHLRGIPQVQRYKPVFKCYAFRIRHFLHKIRKKSIFYGFIFLNYDFFSNQIQLIRGLLVIFTLTFAIFFTRFMFLMDGFS